MKRLLIAGSMAVVWLSPGALPAADGSPYKLVVNAANPVSVLSPEAVSALFLRPGRWEDGTPVLAADLHPDSPVRARFSNRIHGRDVAAIKSYWQKMIFSGQAAPPPELASDEEVLAYVREHPGAIGYVSKATELGRGLRAVAVAVTGARLVVGTPDD